MRAVVPSWHERGLCQQTDPDLFYPEKGSGKGALAQARRICARCEVKPECQQWAIDNAEVYGIWGGLSESERRRMRRGKAVAA